jgi:NAD+ synthase (glutamine-hydrolysing)
MASLLVISLAHQKERLQVAAPHARRLGAPLVYVNQVGAQDEVVFDGNSFVVDSHGKLNVQSSSCEEDLLIVD